MTSASPSITATKSRSSGCISRSRRRGVSRTAVTTLLDGDAGGLGFPLAELVLPGGFRGLVLQDVAARGRARMPQLARLEVGAFGIDLRGQRVRSRLGRRDFGAQALLLLDALGFLGIGSGGRRRARPRRGRRGRGCGGRAGRTARTARTARAGR